MSSVYIWLFSLVSWILDGIHAHGFVGKYTVAAERDPLASLAFLNRFLGTTPEANSCPGNICACKAGDNNATRDFFEVLARASLPNKEYLETHGVGECHLVTKLLGQRTADGFVAITGVDEALQGNDCTYTSGKAIVTAAKNTSYVLAAHTVDQCCKACAADSSCVAATYKAESSEAEFENISWTIEGPRNYSGYGLHVVGRSGIAEKGTISVKELEETLDYKLSDMTTFDSWMDFSIAFGTGDLDSYIKRFDGARVPYFPARWFTSDQNTMYSVFIRAPKSQLIIELISTPRNAGQLASKKDLTIIEQRLSNRILPLVFQLEPIPRLEVIKINRAASDLTALDRFYVDNLHVPTVWSMDSSDVSLRCYLIASTYDLCFVKRHDNATKGSFKVRHMEENLLINQVATSKEPRCNQNRWGDNHFLWPDVPLAEIEEMLRKSELPYLCLKGNLHYIFDPTGWAVQLGLLNDPNAERLATWLPGCSESNPPNKTNDTVNWCVNSNCTTSVNGVPSTECASSSFLAKRYSHLS